MITIDNVVMRNLQEQVQKNKEDIEAFEGIEFTLNNFGIKVLGKVTLPGNIPVGDYEYGDAYLVGLEQPYDMYIYTRTNDPTNPGTWVNIGPLNIVGQPGPTGDQGPAGVDGYAPVVRYGEGIPITESTDKSGYIYIDTLTSKLYTFTDKWNFIVSLQGATGPRGPQGIQGATGTTLSIVGKLASSSLLPTNFASGSIPKNSAYLVTVNNANHLFIILGDQGDYNTWYWQDAGDFNLGSVIYKNSQFQYAIDVTDNYDTSTGAVVTDIATNNMYNTLIGDINKVETDSNDRYDTLNNSLNTVSNRVTDNYNTLSGSISSLESTVESNYNTLNSTINSVSETSSNNYNTLNNSISSINNEINGLVDKIYPIGSIYMSVNNVNPSTLFGGSWEQIKGRFLLGSENASVNNETTFGDLNDAGYLFHVGDMGGSYKHKLTEAEMPKHHHEIGSAYGGIGDGSILQRGWQETTGGRSFATTDIGNNEAHNNMPPYFVVNIWKRTA